tara:strand:- start:150 stop:692 length:543 start_codon:yes stop_codon:yes gene_type:complete
MSEKKISNFFALIIIIASGLSLFKWKEYEERVLSKAKSQSIIPIIEEIKPSPEIVAKVSLLEKMAIKEKEKIRVMVEHDNSPLTNTFPMIMDATSSYDPDVGDEIQYKWRQISGPGVEIRPNPFVGKVSFEGKSGEYVFELTVSDNYGANAKAIRTVVIEPEPNVPPVIEVKVRQGSELN